MQRRAVSLGGMRFLVPCLLVLGPMAFAADVRPAPRWKALAADSADVAARLGLGDRRLPGDGGGGTVGGLIAYQFGYSEEDSSQGDPINLILLEWQVFGANANGIVVYANGGIVAFLGSNETSVVLFGGPEVAGQNTFMVEAEGSTSSDDLFVRTSQPFDDPALSCEGGLVDPRTRTCDLIVSIASQRQPTHYVAAVDGGLPGNELIPGTTTELPISGLFNGQHCVTLLGFLSQNGNDYVGDPVETCCDFQCKDLPCDAPGRFASCQQGFGAGGGDSTVLVTWENFESDYLEIRPVLDGNPLEPLPGASTELELSGLAPGGHILTLQGDCGIRGMSEPSEIQLTVAVAPPTVEPARNLSCRFTSPSAGTLVVTWTTVDRPATIDVYIVAGDDAARLVATLPGEATAATIVDTISTDRAGLRFIYDQDGLCFSSDLLVCAPPPPPAYKFTRADCDGNSSLNLTDGIFSLNYLFRGESPPPCEAACDANFDTRFDLADPVYTLNYLFLSGPPPIGNRPECDETSPGDSCARSTCS